MTTKETDANAGIYWFWNWK